MKKLILFGLPLFAILLSCAPDLDFEYLTSYPPTNPTLSGTPATFTIHENGNTYVVEGDAYSVGYGFYDGPGSALHREIANSYYEPEEYYHKLECIGPYANGGYTPYINFDLFTTYQGQPIDSIVVARYNAHNSVYRNGQAYYQAFHNDSTELNHQLFSGINITRVEGGRMDGTFSGKYIQINPETGEVLGEIVMITGEFKNVYIHE
jgi:hypothetical protein